MEYSKKRVRHMDIAKAIGIILIVLGHSFSENSSNQIRSFVYLFHVPLFFIISGYFFNDNYINNPKKLIYSRVKSIWIPFFYWSLLFIIIHNILFYCNIYHETIGFRNYGSSFYSLFDIIKKICKLFYFHGSEQLLGGFWFLPCLFFSIGIFFIFFIISKKININFSLFLLSFSGFILGNFAIFYEFKLNFIPWDIPFFLVTSFLYFIGYFYKKYENYIPITSFAAIAALVILIIITKLDLVKIISIKSTLGYLPKSIMFLIVTPLLGTYLVIYVSKLIANFKFSSIFVFIGKNTITILALHFLCFKIVNYFIVLKDDLDPSFVAHFPVIPDNDSFFILYLSSGIFIPMAFQLLFNKSKATLNNFTI